MKTCPKCRTEKSLDDFHNKTSAKDGKQSACKVCNQTAVQTWQAGNPEKYKEIWVKNSYGEDSLLKRRAARYGLSVEELTRLLKEADGKCQICYREPNKWLVVDHCHTTLKVRGVICERCNQALGLFGDDVQALQNAIEYLKK